MISIKKYINVVAYLFIMIAIMISSQLQSQEKETFYGDEFTLTRPLTGNYTYIARDKIKLEEPFRYNWETRNYFRAKLDEELNLPVQYLNPNSVPSTAERELDKTLAVGSLPGNLTITPVGQANYNIPVEISPGSGDMEPNLSINYQSNGGNGLLGLRFSIGGLSAITRCGKNLHNDNALDGVEFNADDRFMLDGQRLIMVDNNDTYGADGTEYRTERETYQRIVSFGSSGSGPEYFKVWTMDGRVLEYGNTEDSRIDAQGGIGVLNWYLNKVTDVHGNYIQYQYYESPDNDNAYPVAIEYTGNENTGLQPYNRIKFYYTSNRSDYSKSYLAGSEVNKNELLHSIKVFHKNNVVYDYRFNYTYDDYTHLYSIEKFNNGGKPVNSTIFDWGNDGEDFQTAISDAIPSFANSIVTGDFNGDGQTDFISFSNNWYLYIADANGYSFNLVSQGDLPDDFATFIPGDADGDGLCDVTMIKTSGSAVVYKSIGNDLVEMDYWDFWIVPNSENEILPADFNGDGIIDFMYSSSERNDEWKVASNVYDPDAGGLLWQDYATFTTQAGKKEFGDFNGDGKTDIMFLDEDGYKVYEFVKSPGKITEYEAVLINEGTEFNSNSHIYVSNLNSDGYNDILYSTFIANNTYRDIDQLDIMNQPHNLPEKQRNNNPNNSWNWWDWGEIEWNIAYFKGNNISPEIVPAPQGLVDQGWGHSGGNHSISTQIFLRDFDGDGRIDIMEYEDGDVEIFYNKAYNSFSMSYYDNLFVHDDLNYQLVNKKLGDYNGDGNIDMYLSFMNVDHDYENKIIYFHPNSQKHLVTAIGNGMNYITGIRYNLLTSIAQVDKQKRDQQYPLMVWQGPMNVVDQVEYKDQLGSSLLYKRIRYNYKNPVVHLRGKGLLGYSEQRINESVNNSTTINSYEVLDDHYFMALESSETKINDVSINKTVNTNDVIEYGNLIPNGGGGTRYESFLPVVTKSEYFDYLKGNKAITNYTYTTYYEHEYGMPDEAVKTFSAIGGATEWTETTTNTYKNIIQAVNPGGGGTSKSGGYNKYIIGLLDYLTVNNLKQGENPYARNTDYRYNNLGDVETLIKDPGHAKSITSTFLYDDYGNITRSETVGGGKQIVKQYETDAKGRFTIKEIQPLGHEISNVFDEATGQLLESFDINGLKTSFEYDGNGSLVKTITPDGNYIVNHMDWAENITSVEKPAHTVYVKTMVTSNKGTAYKFYDILGRVLGSASYNYNDQLVYQDIIYNRKWQLSRESLPYYSGNSKQWINYYYDQYGRVDHKIGPTVDASYSYNGREVTSTNNLLNISSTKTYDSRAQLLNSSDAGGEVVYEYYSSGKPKSITTNGSTIEMEYDLLGYQEKLVDPDAGEIQYYYNAFGELNWQENANGIQYEMTYDELGRMLTRTNKFNGITTNWEYDEALYGTLSKAIMKGGTEEKYSYDALGRMVKKTETINKKDYTYEYSYNDAGNIASIAYPGGFTIENVYNANGFLKEVIDAKENAIIWSGGEKNERGQWINYQYGNRIETAFSYDEFGYPSTITAGSAFRQNYVFNRGGQLTRREDERNNMAEEFRYDDLNRLISSKVFEINPHVKIENSSSLLNTDQGNKKGNISELDYYPNGNIKIKSGIGEYSYDAGNKPHAVREVENSGFTMELQNQVIRYTGFNKTAEIIEGKEKLTIEYGLNRQRVITRFFEKDEEKLVRIYAGLYEEEINRESGETRKLYYIPTGNGIAAIREESKEGAGMYYIHKDYLGSWLTITDSRSRVVEERNYDAWGRCRDPREWEYTTTQPTYRFARGYTGHEHYNRFNLVNMNGRMYDPLLGRMLSPDRYVVDPTNTQSYNRYSYVLNNPLMFKDPTGNIPVIGWVFIGVATGIGGYTGWQTAEAMGYDENDWETYFYAFAEAAITGGTAYLSIAMPAAGYSLFETAMVTSHLSNVGWGLMTGFQSDVTYGFGPFSYNVSENDFTIGWGPVEYNVSEDEFDYLGEKGNEWQDDLRFALRTATTIYRHRHSLVAVDTEKKPLGKILQLGSRFTYELPQTIVGMMLYDFFTAFNDNPQRVFHKGITFVRSKLMGGGLSVGNNVFLWDDCNHLDTFKHEFGHTFQSRYLGPLYMPIAAMGSMIGYTNYLITNNMFNYYILTEKWADELGKKYW